MRRNTVRLCIAGVLLVGAVATIASRQESGSTVTTLDAARGPAPTASDAAGLCPWRSADADLKQFFPTATGHLDENLILSRHRAEVASLLGHPPTGTDNILPLHWIVRDQQRLGAIMTRAVRGESGVIELVLAVDANGEVVGARLQRLREPDDVARSLQSPTWLGAWRGKTARSAWQLGRDLPDVPPAARVSAEAVLDGAHTLLVLLEVGSKSSMPLSSMSIKATPHQHVSTGAP
jgi:hypothetical protein